MVTKTVWFLLVVAGCRTSIELPRSTGGEKRDVRSWPTVELTRHGEVVYRGDQTSLSALKAELKKERGEPEDKRLVESHGILYPAIWPDATRRPILLRIDRRAPATHVSWLMRAVGGAGFNRVYVGVRGSAGAAVLAMPLMSPYYLQPPPRDFVDRGVETTPEDLGVARWFLTDSPALPTSVALFLDGFRKKTKRHGVVLLQVRSRMALARIVDAYDKAHARGYPFVQWGHELPHAWAFAQDKLPPLRGDDYLIASLLPFPTQGADRDVIDVRLPLASQATVDIDDGATHRVYLNLDDTGRIVRRDQHMSLDRASVSVIHRTSMFLLLKRARGETAFVERNGKKYTLLNAMLRVPANAPWQHAAWLLALLDAHSFSSAQLAALITPDATWDRSECRLLGATPTDRFPTRPGELDGYLALSLLRPATGAAVVVTASEYRLGPRTTPDPLELGRWLKQGAGPVIVSAGPKVPYKFVVAAANQAVAAGREFFLEHGGLPDSKVMAMRSLPRPR